MMVADFRYGGIVACDKEMLKIVVKTLASRSLQVWSTLPCTPLALAVHASHRVSSE